MHGDVIILRTFANELEAELARTVLEANGIPALVLRNDAGGMYPSLTFVHGVRLVVHRDDAREAIAILDRVDDEELEEPDAPEAPWEVDSSWEGDSAD
jgi:hypothetical protein